MAEKEEAIIMNLHSGLHRPTCVGYTYTRDITTYRMSRDHPVRTESSQNDKGKGPGTCNKFTVYSADSRPEALYNLGSGS